MRNRLGLFLGFALAASAYGAPAGLSIRTQYGKTVFFLPSDKIVYIEQCTENESAPKTIKDCFGATTWPNAKTPMVSARALKDAVSAAKKDDKSLSLQLTHHSELIQARRKVQSEKEQVVRDLSESIAQEEEEIAFVDNRLKDRSLTEESFEALQKSRQLHIGTKFSLEAAKSKAASEVGTQKGFISTLSDSRSGIQKKIDSEKVFNRYLDDEQSHFFAGTTARNLSASELFAQTLIQLASPRVEIYWEGPETIKNLRNPEISYKLALRRLVVKGAISAGDLEISFRKLFWSKDLPSLKIKVDQDFIENGAALSGDYVPSDYRQEDGRLQLTIRDARGSTPPSYLAVGKQVLQVKSLDGSDKFASFSQEGLVGDLVLKNIASGGRPADISAQLTLPLQTGQVDLFSSKLNTDGKAIESQSYVNGIKGHKDCPGAVRIEAAYGESRYSPELLVRNGESLRFRILEGILALTSIDKACNYSGPVQTDYRHSPLRSFTLDGIRFVLDQTAGR